MFDVFYIGSNKALKSDIPFAKKVKSADDITPKTKMYWLIEPNIEVIDDSVFSYKPEMYDTVYEHVWKWNTNNYGGIRLIPSRQIDGVKEINQVVCKKKFDIIHTKTPAKYFDKNPYASHVWCVDKGYKLTNDIDWAPGNFEPSFIHSFHLRGQLEHKYPAEEGGIKLYPRDWKKADIKYHKFLDATETFPILYVKDVDDYTQRNILQEDFVWLIDLEHKFNIKTVDWVPNPFEGKMIHAFRMPYQLTEKYPMAMGGIRLVPRLWEEAETKIHPACPIEDENYDVFYIEEDEFSPKIYEEYAERSKTDWFWVVDREFEFNGKLLFVPAEHEKNYIHVFKIPGHLEERYPIDYTDPWDRRCGGVRLINKHFDFTKSKYHPNISPVRYDVFYTENINDYESSARKSRTKMFWLVDNEHDINEVFKYVPGRHDQKTIQIFKIPNQLEHKYPKSVTNVSDNRCGGVKLVPKVYNLELVKYIASNPTSDRSYPVIKVDDVDKATEVFQDCWIVDTEYEINQKIEWSPPAFQKKCIHTFHLGEQLRYKFPEAMGGIRWVPVDWNGDIVIHSELLNAIPEYPIYYHDDPSADPNKDHSCWLADTSYRLDENIKWAPGSFDTDKIHVFHILNQLTNKYPEEMGGLYWYPKNSESKEIKIHKDPLYINAKTYPIFKVNNPKDAQAVTEDCWLVDQEYILEDDDFNFVPWQNEYEKDQIHVYQVRGQLEHKYPEEMGGIYWVPANHKDAGLNIHDSTPFGEQLTFPVFDSEEKGRQESTSFWFWVVDPDVEVLENFDFTFVPKIWDNGKTHVWQKLNPVTKRQYDYGGVKLCSKEPPKAGRPKYMREPACVQSKYPVYHLQPEDYKDGLNDVYVRLASQTTTDMFWVVDAFTILHEDFMFDYYPTQWDKKDVHVFADQDKNFKNIRLVPKKTFLEKEYTDEEIVNNTFEDIKQINTIASQRPIWPMLDLTHQYPVHHLQPDDYKDGLNDIYVSLANQATTDMFWVVDPFTVLHEDFKFEYYPAKEEKGYVHVFADQDGEYKNVRLVPKKTFLEKEYTDKEIANNTFEDIKQINIIASQRPIWPMIDLINQYPVHHLQPRDYKNGLNDVYVRLASQATTDMFWVVDAFTELHDDFNFEYYPAKEEKKYVHVFVDQDGEYKNVRLVPRKTFLEKEYTDKEIANNSFEDIKQINIIASQKPIWPVIDLTHQYPVYYLQPDDYKDGLNDVYMGLARQTTTDMFWVVDAFTVLYDDFKFEYYPAKEEKEYVHVFADQDGEYKNVRLMPRKTFLEKEYTDKEIANNSFEDIKQVNTIASQRPIWPMIDLINQYPVYYLHADDYKDGLNNLYVRLADQTDTDMFWVVDAFTVLRKGFKFEYYPAKEEKKYLHVFADQDGEYKNVRLVPRKTFLEKEYTDKEIANNSFADLKQINTIASQRPIWPVVYLQSVDKKEFINTIKDIELPFVWTVDPDVKVDESVLDKGFMPDIIDVNKIHAWQKFNLRTQKIHAYGGLRLWPTNNDYSKLKSDDLKHNKFRNLEYVREVGSSTNPYEIFLISYKEDQKVVDEHIRLITNKGLTYLSDAGIAMACQVDHIRGVKGIFEAHKVCAEKSKTKMFWVVDADAEVTQEFNFDYIPDVYDEEVVHVWASKNPINNLEYGYGGIKLFPTEMVRNATTWGLDFTTGLSSRFRAMPQISCITKFNTDAYSTWRSAFRECVKLTFNDDAESKARLDAWLNTRGNEDFTDEAVKGALEGNQFALANKNDLEMLSKINDYEWLDAQYNRT